MNHRFIALALAGTLTLGMLTACGGGNDNVDTTPSNSPVVETTPVPESSAPVEETTPVPESSAPAEETESPDQEEPSSEPSAQPSTKPTAKPTTQPTAKPTTKPTTQPTTKPTATPTPTTKPTATPAPTPTAKPQVDVVSSVWNGISALELPSMIQLDDSLLASFYGINASDLVSYKCAMPAMAVHATEFFVAEVKSGKMDTVKAGIAKRQADLVAQWSQYLPEQLELVENYKLVTSGNYILFAISDQADQAVSIFNSYTK